MHSPLIMYKHCKAPGYCEYRCASHTSIPSCTWIIGYLVLVETDHQALPPAGELERRLEQD
uniref:Uncharacterized protein n=1 Tax=Arundo donax TaxID=35708 RepID=A0A0A8YFW0_ARUDO